MFGEPEQNLRNSQRETCRRLSIDVPTGLGDLFFPPTTLAAIGRGGCGGKCAANNCAFVKGLITLLKNESLSKENSLFPCCCAGRALAATKLVRMQADKMWERTSIVEVPTLTGIGLWLYIPRTMPSYSRILYSMIDLGACGLAKELRARLGSKSGLGLR